MKIFGRNYNEIGNTDSDFCIITRGQVKIQYGKKFIDLIKDGRINCDLDFIFKVKDKDSIKGGDGVYLVGDSDLYIKVGSLIIPIHGSEASSNFVSYNEEQDKNEEEILIAQKNIGISFDTLADFVESGIKNGAAYITGEGKIYIMKNGTPTELSSEMPNPYTKPLWIQLSQASGKSYSLFIDGYFSTSGAGIVIGSTDNGMHLYSELNKSFMDCAGEIYMNVSGTNIIKISRTMITCNADMEFGPNNKMSINNIQSNGAGPLAGFSLFVDSKGFSHLYVDELHVRAQVDNSIHLTYEELKYYMEQESLTPNLKYCIDDYQNEWDIVDEISEDEFDDEDNLIRRRNVLPLIVTAIASSKISESAYYLDYPQWSLIYDFKYNDLLTTIGETEVKARGRIKRMYDEYKNSAPYDFKNLRFKIDGEWKYTFGGEFDKSITGEFYGNNIQGQYDKIEKRCVENSENVEYCLNEGIGIVSISGSEIHDNEIGIISGKFVFDNGDTGIFKYNDIYSDELGEVEIKGDFINNSFVCEKIINTDFPKGASHLNVRGGFENCSFNDKPIYTNFHSLVKDTQFFGEEKYDVIYTEKVTDVYMNEEKLRIICIPDFCWPGMITMYNGEWEIPKCWALCDGTNGTPDLTDSFIKGSSTFGPASSGEYMDYPFEINSGNVPLADHTHSVDVPECDCEGSTGTRSSIKTTTLATSGYSMNDLVRSDIEISPLAMVSSSGVNEGGLVSRVLEIKPPKFYKLIFIMYVGG